MPSLADIMALRAQQMAMTGGSPDNPGGGIEPPNPQQAFHNDAMMRRMAPPTDNPMGSGMGEMPPEMDPSMLMSKLPPEIAALARQYGRM